MIIDTIQNAPRYFSLHPLFEKAFEFILDNDLLHAPDGKNDIGEGLKVIISNAPGKTRAQSLEKFECHDKFIDIQLCIKGNETLGWKPRENCMVANGIYNEEKDVRFYSDAPDTWIQLKDNQFAIFFPHDVHAPMVGEAEIKKLVIKVNI